MLTDERVWKSDSIMAANADAGLKMPVLMALIRAIEAEVIQAQEPVGYANGDELDNLLDDRSITIAARPNGFQRTPIFTTPQPPVPCPKCAKLEEENRKAQQEIAGDIVTIRKCDNLLKLSRAKVAYYEAQMCLPDGAFVAIPSGYTAQVAARSVSPERVADVLTQREELRAKVERLTQKNAELREKLHDESAQHVQFMLHDHPKALAARDATIAQQAERIAELERERNEWNSKFLAANDTCEMQSAALEKAREALKGIVEADYRKWEELATADEFVRWAKSRANYALAALAAQKGGAA